MAYSPLRTVHIRWSSPPAAAEAAIAVEGGGGVDLTRVGRALGLDPATVRLNGYFLSRGPGHVSSAVTWRALLAFFAARGLPTGADAGVPVAVHGRPAPSTSRLDPTILLCSKRKSGLEAEIFSKKSKLQENSSTLSKSGDELLSDDITLGLKRRLRLDETSPAKRTKRVEYNSDPTILLCSKRKSGLEAENFSKKSKLQENSSTLLKSGDELLSDDITLGLKRRLRLDETSPAKRTKRVEYNSVNGAETQQPVKFSCSFIDGHAKCPRNEEMVTSVSCERVR